MNHSVRRVLLSQDEYDRLLSRAKPSDADIRLKEYNSNMIKDKIIKKNNEAAALKKLDDQIQSLTPIKTVNVSPPSLSQSVNLPAQTMPKTVAPPTNQPQPPPTPPPPPSPPPLLASQPPESSSPVAQDVLGFLEQNTNKTNRSRVLKLYNLLRQNPSVRVTKDKIYVDDQPLPNAATLDIMKHLVGRAGKLKYSGLNPLLDALSDQNVKGIVQNKGALTMLNKAHHTPLKTSTPKKEPSFRRPKSRSRSRLKTDESDVFFSQDEDDWITDDDMGDGNDGDDDEPTLQDPLGAEKGYGKIKPRWVTFWN